MKFRYIDKAAFIILILFVVKFFDYIPLRETVKTNIVLTCFLFFMLARLLIEKEGVFSKRKFFDIGIVSISISMLLSCLCCIIMWDQKGIGCIKSIIPMMSILCIYFYFFRTRPSENFLMGVFLTVTIIWAFIEWYQQITYPHYYFCGRIEDVLEKRMGLVRFYITGVHCSIFCLVYYLGKLQEKNNWKTKYFLFYAIALIGIVGFVSRKQIYSSLLCSAILILNIKSKNKLILRSLLAVIALIFVYLLFSSMQELNQQTMNEIANDDFVRYLSMNYFLTSFSDNWYYYVFGTGIPPTDGSLYNKFQNLSENYNFYVSDCGIIGYFVHFGIVGVTVFLALIYKVLRKWRYLLLWHKLYLIYYLVLILIAFWGNSFLGLLSFVVYIYMVDRHLAKVVVGSNGKLVKR